MFARLRATWGGANGADGEEGGWLVECASLTSGPQSNQIPPSLELAFR